MGRNLWDTVSSEVQGSSMALWLFVVGFVAGVVGIVLSMEDFVSSYHGIRSLELAFGVTAVSHVWVYYVMAIAPWVGQVAFIGLWTLDTSRFWALMAGIVWFALDFVSDVQYRSGGSFVPLDGQPADVGPGMWVSMAMTFLYFTIGAELFVMASSALVVTLFPSAVRELAQMRARTTMALEDARKVWRGTDHAKRSSRRQGRPIYRTAQPQAQAERKSRRQVPQAPQPPEYVPPLAE